MPVSGVESELVEVLPEEVLLEDDWLELDEASLEAEINVEEDDAEDEEGIWREEEAVESSNSDESSSEESSSEDSIDDSLDGGSFLEVADDACEDWILDPAGPKEREHPVNARAQEMTSKGTRFIRLL